MIKRETSEKVTLLGVVCAVMVMYIHVMLLDNAAVGSLVWWVWSLFTSGICSVAVPFFFVVSGFFLACRMEEDRWWQIALRKRARSLLVPYVFWSVVVTGFVFAVLAVGPFGLSDRIALPGGVARWQRFPTGQDILWNPPLYPFWYIRMLFFLVLASPVIKWLLDRLGVLLPAFLFGIGLMVDAFPSFLPVTVRQLLMTTFPIRGVLYFTIGAWLQRHPVGLVLPRSGGLMAFVLGLGCFGVRAYALYLHRPELAGCSGAIAIPLTLAGLFALCPAVSQPKFLSGTSFPIFVLHTPVLFALDVLFIGILHFSLHLSIVCYFLEGVLACAFCVVLAIPVPLFIPWAFGGR